MAKLVALERDGCEARVAVGRTRGRDVVVEQVFAVDLGEDAADTIDEQITARIASALTAHNVGRADALVAVGRSNIELRQMKLPPCPPEEQPEMVRFQAMREFSNIGDDWPLDFVRLNCLEDDESLNVLAAVIKPELLDQFRSFCKEVDLTPRRMPLRPFAAASLLERHRPDSGCRMMVDVLADEADLTVLIGGDVVFMRTVRLPSSGEPKAVAQALVGEIRRTIPAAQNQTGGRRVEKLTLCGAPHELTELRATLSEALSQEIEDFNPFDHIQAGSELRENPPEFPGRYASLLGMLSDHDVESHRGIDFLNPRKKPKPKSNRRRHAILAAGAAVIVVAAGLLAWSTLADKRREVAKLRDQITLQEPQVEKMKARTFHLQEIRAFQVKDIRWLDVLREFSDRLPASDRALITSMTMSPDDKGQGRISLQGFVDDSSTVGELQQNMATKEWRVKPQTVDLDPQQFPGYPYRHSYMLIVSPKDTSEEEPSVKDDPKQTKTAKLETAEGRNE